MADATPFDPLAVLAKCTVVDLSQRISPQTPMWPETKPPTFTDESTIASDGSFSRRLEFSEHTGTHLDAPAHFCLNGPTVEQVPARSLVLAAVLIDISARSRDDATALLLPEDILAEEDRNGPIPPDSAVLVHTGWERFLGDDERYIGPNGTTAFPGYEEEAARMLVDWRAVSCLGIDTLGIDAGAAASFPVHSTISLPRGVTHLEGLIHLDRLPHRGAWIVIGALPLLGGSGAPARVLALVP